MDIEFSLIPSSNIFFAPEVQFDQLAETTTWTSSSFLTLQVYSSYITDVNTPIDELLFYSPSIEQSGAAINLAVIPDSLHVFRPFIRQSRISPLRFKYAESVLGGATSSDILTGQQDYKNINSTSSYDNKSDFSFGHITGLLPNYVPSYDALFSKTYYRAFYVVNDSTFDTRKNIEFWIDGGNSYRLRTTDLEKTIHESEYLIAADKALFNAELSAAEEAEFKLSGGSRTSLYGQLEVSYLVSPTLLLYPFAENGVGVGINLSRENFTDGNVKVTLPNLAPGKSVGIYLKVTTKFDPDFSIPRDYAFLHLEYLSTSTGMRERYPGQLRNGNSFANILLPSISILAETSYSGINEGLTEELNRFYDRYPPYFSHYEDISE